MGIPKKKKLFIKRNYSSMTVEELARQTGLNAGTIRNLAKELDLDTGEPSPTIETDSTQQKGSSIVYIIPLIVLAAAALIVYSNTFHSSFVFDDVIIRDNPSIHISRIMQAFSFLTEDDASRRVGMISFALNFYFSGMDPAGYRIVNIIIHILNAYCLFLLIYWTFTKSKNPAVRVPGNKAFTMALAGSCLWLVHPLQIQAVTYIIQRFTSLASLFMLISLLLYIRGRLSRSKLKFLYFILSISAGILALGSKQTAGALPGVILLYEICFLGGIKLSLNSKTLKYAGIIVLASAIISGIYLWQPQSTLMERFAERNITPSERVLTETRVLVYYISLVVFPNPSRLNVDYDFPKSTGLLNPLTTIPALLCIVVLVAFGIYLVVRNHAFAGFSILWFFGNLVIESTIIPLDLVYEHRLYTPSMMPIVLFVLVIFSIRNKTWKWAGYGFFGVIALLFAWWTYQRNFVWKDAVTLWEDNIRKSPNKARVHGNLGKAYLDTGQNEKALDQFERVLQLDPSLLGAYDNIATIYINYYEDYARARDYLFQALSKNPDYPSPYMNLGVINLRLKQLPEAIQNFEKVLQLDPENGLGYYNLAAAYFNLKDYREAESILRKGLSIWPRNDQLYGLLGLTCFEQDRFSDSETALRKALNINPQNSMARMYMQKLQESGH